MKAIVVAIVALLIGCSFGAGVAYFENADPGSNFALLEVQPFTPAEKSVGVGGSDTEGPGSAGPDKGSDSGDPSVAGADAGSTKDINRLPIEVLNGEEFDFGTMEQGEKRSHTFVFKNNTNEEVALKVLETTCKCTIPNMEDDAVPPYGEVDVKLEWKPIALQRDFRQSALIATSCTERREIRLSVFGQVSQSILADPYDIAFSDVSFRSARESELLIHAYVDKDLEITGHTWANQELEEFFEYEFIEVTDEHRAISDDALKTIAGRVSLKPGMDLGPFRQVLQLKTNQQKFGLLEIPVRGRIVGDVTLSGDEFLTVRNLLRMGPVPQKKGRKLNIRLTAKGPFAKGFKVLGSRSKPDMLKVEVKSTIPLNKGLITMISMSVEIPPNSRPVNYMGGENHDLGRVTLETNHPQLKEVPFDVEFAITE